MLTGIPNIPIPSYFNHDRASQDVFGFQAGVLKKLNYSLLIKKKATDIL